MVPGSFGFGSAVLAAMTILAPSFAARSAMARPMPRLAPVMNKVFPWSDMVPTDLQRSHRTGDRANAHLWLGVTGIVSSAEPGRLHVRQKQKNPLRGGPNNFTLGHHR